MPKQLFFCAQKNINSGWSISSATLWSTTAFSPAEALKLYPQTANGNPSQIEGSRLVDKILEKPENSK
jgi:hypothetical protein